MVDDEDADSVSKYKWHLIGAYAARSIKVEGKRRTIFLHHFIIGRPGRGFMVDHSNGDKLDNRRFNLRFATYSQNGHNIRTYRTNKSGFKGVWWSNDQKCWMAVTQFHGRAINIGKFATAYAAHLAYRAKVKELFGEFANDGFGPIA